MSLEITKEEQYVLIYRSSTNMNNKILPKCVSEEQVYKFKVKYSSYF